MYLCDEYQPRAQQSAAKHMSLLLKVLGSHRTVQIIREAFQLGAIQSVPLRLLAAAINLFNAEEYSCESCAIARSRLALAWLDIAYKLKIRSSAVEVETDGFLFSCRQRVDPGSYSVNSCQDRMFISPQTGNEVAFGVCPILPVAANITFIGDRCCTTFVAASNAEIVRVSDHEAADFLSTLRSSLALIAHTSENVAQALESDLWAICAIAHDDSAVHRSFSSAQLPGAVFLSLNADDLGLAEALLHEHAHSQLNVMSYLAPLCKEEYEAAVFYSPWREDARPLNGLLHALYVFTEVAVFLHRLWSERTLYGARIDRIEIRLAAILGRLQIGLRQVDEDCLTDFGSEVLGSIKQRTLALTSGETLFPPPKRLDMHMRRWRVSNPHLAVR